jgi:hypothetical protein
VGRSARHDVPAAGAAGAVRSPPHRASRCRRPPRRLRGAPALPAAGGPPPQPDPSLPAAGAVSRDLHPSEVVQAAEAIAAAAAAEVACRRRHHGPGRRRRRLRGRSPGRPEGRASRRPPPRRWHRERPPRWRRPPTTRASGLARSWTSPARHRCTAAPSRVAPLDRRRAGPQKRRPSAVLKVAAGVEPPLLSLRCQCGGRRPGRAAAGRGSHSRRIHGQQRDVATGRGDPAGAARARCPMSRRRAPASASAAPCGHCGASPTQDIQVSDGRGGPRLTMRYCSRCERREWTHESGQVVAGDVLGLLSGREGFTLTPAPRRGHGRRG